MHTIVVSAVAFLVGTFGGFAVAALMAANARGDLMDYHGKRIEQQREAFDRALEQQRAIYVETMRSSNGNIAQIVGHVVALTTKSTEPLPKMLSPDEADAKLMEEQAEQEARELAAALG